MLNNTFAAVDHFPAGQISAMRGLSPVFINSIGMSGGQFIQISKNLIFLAFFSSAFQLSLRPEQMCPQFEIKTSKESGMNEIGVS